MPTTDEFIAAATLAAPRFGLEPATVELLSHSENVVCALTLADATRLVMRLHRPGYNSPAELESEVLWVQALGEAGLPVPSAVAATAGGHYEEIMVGDEMRQVGVVRWVDGTPLGSPVEAGDANLAPHYRTIGSLTAAIRHHSATWAPPAGFTRRRWDADGFVGNAPLWGRFWDVARLSPGQRSLFVRARDQLRDELGALPTTPDRFGLIHSDLHLGNLMNHQGDLTMIDFDDAGFGWFSHELAIALHPSLDEPWFDEARSELLDGYRQVHPLSDHEEDLIDTFLTMRWLMIIGWLDARPELPIHEQFDELLGAAEVAVAGYLAR